MCWLTSRPVQMHTSCATCVHCTFIFRIHTKIRFASLLPLDKGTDEKWTCYLAAGVYCRRQNWLTSQLNVGSRCVRIKYRGMWLFIRNNRIIISLCNTAFKWKRVYVGFVSVGRLHWCPCAHPSNIPAHFVTGINASHQLHKNRTKNLC